MGEFDVIIIGSGLGGLICANILSKEGMKVCVLEMDKRIGGTLQSFAKEGVLFNTGLNYTESLSEGEVLYRYFNFLGLMDDLNIQRLDLDAFDKISLGEDEIEYPFAQGHENFIERMSEFFPKERANLQKYFTEMGEVCNAFPYYNLESDNYSLQSLGKQQSVSEFLRRTTPDRKLQKVLAGMNSLYAGVEGQTPMYIHSLINYSFIKSAWRLVNGSSQLALLLAKGIKANGGVIRTEASVVALEGEKNTIHRVRLESGEYVHAKQVISNAHPAATIELLSENMVRKVYRNRILSLENSIGMFSLYLVLKKDRLDQFNYNYHHFPNSNVWGTQYSAENWPEHFMLYSPANLKGGEYANGLTVISYMNFSEISQWQNTTRESRPQAYYDFKDQKAEILLKAVEERFPGIHKHIKSVYSSTPLSYRDYTGTPNGSAYGIKKDAENPMLSLVTPKSRVNNLLFTGQNLNMHGILGVTIGAVMTCQELLGSDYLINKIRKY
ncbi:phytoene desaturase family protein [Labilibaculum euxinus]